MSRKTDRKKNKTTIGYRANGYNATFEKATFLVTVHPTDTGNVLEVTDADSGITFIITEENAK